MPTSYNNHYSSSQSPLRSDSEGWESGWWKDKHQPQELTSYNNHYSSSQSPPRSDSEGWGIITSLLLYHCKPLFQIIPNTKQINTAR